MTCLGTLTKYGDNGGRATLTYRSPGATGGRIAVHVVHASDYTTCEYFRGNSVPLLSTCRTIGRAAHRRACPQIEKTVLLDVTIRDGGYVNGHSWNVAQAARVVGACRLAGIPYVEVGYLRDARHDVDGTAAPSASCPPGYLEKCGEAAGEGQLVVMAHAKDTTPRSVARLAGFGVGLVRMPTRPDQVEKLAPYGEAVRDAGMSFAVNLIRVSELGERDIADAARAAEKVSADIFYLADSNGSLFPEKVTRLCRLVRGTVGTALGFHAHDGIRLGFANTLAAIREGFTYVDASLCGMGKGGGNLSLELITAYLRSRNDHGLAVTPLVEAAAELLTPWKGSEIIAQCESIAGGILDLNLDELTSIRGTDPKKLFAILDSTPVAG